MGESITRLMREFRMKEMVMLDDESYNVSEAKGKLSRTIDFTCFDKGCYKLIKICYKCISQKELTELLEFNESPHGSNTILQIDFWDKYKKKPHREKLFYNDPGQRLPKGLKGRVK